MPNRRRSSSAPRWRISARTVSLYLMQSLRNTRAAGRFIRRSASLTRRLFQLDRPAAGDSGLVLTITLDFRSEFAGHQLGHFRIFGHRCQEPAGPEPMPADVKKILAIAADSRNESQQAALRKFYRENISNEQSEIKSGCSFARSRTKPRRPSGLRWSWKRWPSRATPSFFFAANTISTAISFPPDVPKGLPPLPKGAPHNRLGLAEWLVSPTNPLTARVAVNRYWQAFFGTGIVKTAGDFGSQGEEPSASRCSTGWPASS